MTTKPRVEQRWSAHKYVALKRDSDIAFHNAIRKYGWENFHFRVLAQANDLTELKLLEIKFIEEYQACNPSVGYNRTRGGDGDNSPKHGKMAKGVRSTWITQETKQKLSKATQQRNNEWAPKRVQATKDDQVLIFESASEAAKQLGLRTMNVSMCCLGKVQKPRHGWKFEYV